MSTPVQQKPGIATSPVNSSNAVPPAPPPPPSSFFSGKKLRKSTLGAGKLVKLFHSSKASQQDRSSVGTPKSAGGTDTTASAEGSPTIRKSMEKSIVLASDPLLTTTKRSSKKAMKKRSKLHHNSDDITNSWISAKKVSSSFSMDDLASIAAGAVAAPIDFRAEIKKRRSSGMSPLRDATSVGSPTNDASINHAPRRDASLMYPVDKSHTPVATPVFSPSDFIPHHDGPTPLSISSTHTNSSTTSQSRIIFQEPIHNIMDINIKHHVLYAAIMLGRFDKMSEDELQLEEDEIVYVIRECDDMWLLGVTIRGEIGFFGENFCRRLPDIPPVINPEVRKMLVFEYQLEDAGALIWKTWKQYKERKIMRKVLRKIYLRRYILNEWIDQEKINLQDLQTLNNLYYEPLKNAPHILKPEDFNEIFNGFPDLHKTGTRFSQDLIDLNGNEREMLKLFNSQCPDFQRDYLTFVVNLDTSIQRISDCTEKNILFRTFIKEQRRNPDAHNKTLLDLQTKPFKSLIHMQNIIVRLHKDTPTESYANDLLDNAHKNIISVINFINDTKKHIQNRISMKNLQDEIHNFEIVKAWRYPVISGVLHIQTARSSHFKPLKAHLMNDVFLFVKKQRLHVFYLVFTRLQVDMHDVSNLHMHLDNGLTHVDIKFKNSSEKTRWVQAFAECYASEKQYARENNIHTSVNQMFANYRQIIKTVADISKKIDKKSDIYRYYRKRMDEATQNIEVRRKQFVAYVKDQQAQRKALNLQAQEGKNDFEALKRDRLHHINNALESLEHFKVIMRRDEKNFSDLFGPSLAQLEQLKFEEKELFTKDVDVRAMWFKFRTDMDLEYDPELETLGDSYSTEMENVRQLIKSLDSHEHSFNMMASAAEVQAQMHTANEQINMMRNKNRELKSEVERLHKVVDTASKELARIDSEGRRDAPDVQKATQLIAKLQDLTPVQSLQERILELENERDFFKARASEQETRCTDLMMQVNELRSKAQLQDMIPENAEQEMLLNRKRHLEDQNHRLQEEILQLQTALTDSRREKAALIQDRRQRGKTLLQVHAQLLSEREEFEETLSKERAKNKRLHSILHRLHESNLQSTQRSWQAETALDIQRGNTEELRIESLKNYYRIGFLEKELLAVKSKERDINGDRK